MGGCPIYYNHYNTGRPHTSNLRYVSCYQDIPTESYYPFGYGLSYSKFEYYDLKISSKEIKEDSKIIVSVKVKNNSNIPGYEIIELYLQDMFANVVRPVKELKAFKKQKFEAFEEKTVIFEITVDMLKFWNENLEYKAEYGEFKVLVGADSANTIEKKFEYIK